MNTIKEVIHSSGAVFLERNKRRLRIVILQRRITHYRVPLFNLLREELDTVGIELTVVYGDPTLEELKKGDSGELPWGVHVPTTYLLNGRLCWQNSYAAIRGADLVVIAQENKLLHNQIILLAPRRYKLAFWGHGANLQSESRNGIKERFKRWTTNHVDWWFAYTKMSVNLIIKNGFPNTRITTLNNAVDTRELCHQRESILPEETQALRSSLGFGAGPVGVFVGSLYAEKRLDFLFLAADAIRRLVPDFHLLIIGDGNEHDKVQAFCAERSWASWVGSRLGRNKVAYISIAQVTLNPGLVGLGILDTFVCGVPILTTECGIHSPEIAYLENGVNGIITENKLNAYVETTVRLLRDPLLLNVLRDGCFSSINKYTIKNMAHNFATGLIHCLQTPNYHERGDM